MERIRRIITVVLGITLLVFCSTICACAATDMKSEREGSITIHLEDGKMGVPKVGVRFSCEQVAEYIDGKYRLVEQFQDSMVDLNQITYAKDLEQAITELCGYATKEGTLIETNQFGICKFNHLQSGCYLLTVTDQSYYERITPMLISIPMWSEADKQMQYDIAVIPKHSPEQTEIPKTPQTGDASQLLLCCGAVVVTGAICIAILLLKKKR